MVKRKYLLFKQSSELEILLSAAIIFAAYKLNDGIAILIADALNNNVPGDNTLMIGLSISGLYLSILLPISISLYFVVRVYWLSLIGLKSAFSNEINEQSLSSYAPTFTKWLPRLPISMIKSSKLIE